MSNLDTTKELGDSVIGNRMQLVVGNAQRVTMVENIVIEIGFFLTIVGDDSKMCFKVSLIID